MIDMISMFLNLPRLTLWLNMWSILENVPFALEKKCILLLDGMSYRYELSPSRLTLMAESEEELKSLLMKVKEEIEKVVTFKA